MAHPLNPHAPAFVPAARGSSAAPKVHVLNQQDAGIFISPPGHASTLNPRSGALPATPAQTGARRLGRRQAVPNGRSQGITNISATEEARSAGIVTNTELECRDETFYITLETAPGKFEKFEVKAMVPKGMDYKVAEKFWENQLRYLAGNRPGQLPASRETHNMFVNEDGLEVVKKGTRSRHNDEGVLESCKYYATNKETELKTTLQHFEVRLKSTSPIFNINQPAVVKHAPGSCFLHVALQAVLNDPILLRELPLATIRSDDRGRVAKEKALQEIREVVNAYKEHQEKREGVPISEILKLRKALVSIPGSTIRDNSDEQDANEVFRLIDDLVLGNCPFKTTVRTVRVLDKADKEVLLGKADANNGMIDLPLVGHGSPVKLETLLQNHRLQNNPDAKARSRVDGQKYNVKTAVTTFSKPTDRLEFTFGRYADGSANKIETEVQLPCNLEMSAEHYDTRRPEHYELSTVILHDGSTIKVGHFRVLIRKPDGSGSFQNFHCDDFPLSGDPIVETVKDADKFLKDNATKIYKAFYFKKGILNSAVVRQKNLEAQKAAEQEDAAAAASTSPTEPGTASSAAAASGEEEMLVFYKNNKPDDRLPLRVVSGNMEAQPPATLLVNFANEDLSSNTLSRLDAAVTNAAKAVLNSYKTYSGKLLPEGKIWNVRTAITTVGDHQIIHVNAGTTKEQLEKAVTAVLKAAKGKVEEIAIPLVTIEGLPLQDTFEFLRNAALGFATNNPDLKIKIVLTPSQRDILKKQLEKTTNTPGIGAAPAVNSPAGPASAVIASPPSDVPVVAPEPDFVELIPTVQFNTTATTQVNFSVVQYKKDPPPRPADVHYAEWAGAIDNMLVYDADPAENDEIHLGEFNILLLEAGNKKRVTIGIKAEAAGDIKQLDNDKTVARFRKFLENKPGFKNFTDIQIIILPPKPAVATAAPAAT